MLSVSEVQAHPRLALGAFLTEEELFVLTGKHTRPARIKQLKAKGIPYAVNGIGRLIVLRSAVEQRFGIESKVHPLEPDFAAIR